MKRKLRKKAKNKILVWRNAVVFSLLFFYLLVNIIFSQSVSPLYYHLVKEDKGTAVSFLTFIKKLPSFPRYLEMNKKIYGPEIENKIFAEDKVRKEKIHDLEFLLNKNPKARDVLYNLYKLYRDAGNNIKAEKYLNQAKEIDPTIK